MGYQEELQELFGLTTVTYKANLSKDELFDEAIANDRGRVEEGGPDDAQKAFPTKLGKNGPLIFYSDPTCTGRPVQDTFGVAWPEFEEKVWWKPDFQKFPADKFEPLMRRVGEHLNARSASLYVKDVYAGSDPEYAVPYRFVGEFAS
ncbi:MAG: phosphoenolpyruvate carboxykinase (ATP), partial [Planctomycetota bacterium]|nr:phosphoenolpyruvate carboxykinase (ATP) [Planctomycetota bacterium]